MSGASSILIFTQNPALRNTLADFLALQKMEVITVADAAEAKKALSAHDIETMIIDGTMADFLRTQSALPACLLLAEKGAAMPEQLPNILMEILEKPVRLHEIARGLETLRQRRAQAAIPPIILFRRGVGACVFAPAERTVTYDQKMIILTQKEAELLAFLHRQRGQFVPADNLLREVWGAGEGVNTHTVQTHISRLRAKLRPLGEIIRIAGNDAGYQLDIAQ